MSHELRTPLNSLLMLSKLMADNPEGNLTERQIKAARTIHAGGSELLSLINDILDLSKIESGTVTLDIGELMFPDILEQKERMFGQVAQDKGLRFSTEIDPALPMGMRTDEKRLRQVVQNLLSNAFKFTEEGEVKLQIRHARTGWSPDHPVLDAAPHVVAFCVSDTGIGIPADKQKIIFEAFQQADGTTNRKYGGTGLGLSISRELARLLGGEITLTSQPGKGSTFTLYLPLEFATPRTLRSSVSSGGQNRLLTVNTKQRPELLDRDELIDDRHVIRAGDIVALIVENRDDVAKAAVAAAKRAGFKALMSAVDDAVMMVRRYHPNCVLLGFGDAEMDRWTLLDLLKQNPQTRDLPVHVLSGPANQTRALSMAAFGFSDCPSDSEALLRALRRLKDLIGRRERTLLVVGAGDGCRGALARHFVDDVVAMTFVPTLAEAQSALRSTCFDGMIVELAGSHGPGIDVIEANTASYSDMPIIIYESAPLSPDLTSRLDRLDGALRIRRATLVERALDETATLLHCTSYGLRSESGKGLERDPLLAGRKVLVIDDDFRNIFALTSALEQREMEVFYAETGGDGIEMLKSRSDIDITLVDVMMPELDGYETMREIRKIDRLASLPLIAVTAKAMKGDREKCFAAGASDYLAKPVDVDRLLSMMRVWLCQNSSLRRRA